MVFNCLNLLKEKYENICDCDICNIVERNEEICVYIYLCKTHIKISENDNVDGERYFLIVEKDSITLESLQQLVEFYEKFVVNKCNGMYRKVQLIICVDRDINPLIGKYIEIYNNSFKDTRPSIILKNLKSLIDKDFPILS